jgi:hypothetical protein
MDAATAAGILEKARNSVASGEGLGGTGFWKLVNEIKVDPSLDTFVDEVAELDQRAFADWALLTVPLWLGTTLMVAGTIVGLVLVGLSYSAEGAWSAILLLAGTGVVLVTTHGLGHLVVGQVAGIGFTSWFIGTLGRPQPGVKTDYRTYLRASASGRAWMHAAGAIVTKIVPFVMIGAGLAADVPTWAVLALAAIGIVSIVTDILWSTSSSDWKKFLRERDLEPQRS